MNKKKKLTVLLVLLLVAVLSFAGYVTYARYISRGSGEQAVDVAKWAFTLDGVTATSNTTVTLSPDVAWNANTDVVSGKIAPGMTGSATMVLDPTGTEVAFNFYVKASFTGDFNNENIKAGTVTAGMCSDGTSTNETACTGDNTWTPITLTDGTGEYEGFLKGTVTLPEGAAMAAAQKVNVSLPVEWTDGHGTPTTPTSSAADQADTATGIADPTNGKVVFDVIVEQKVA